MKKSTVVRKLVKLLKDWESSKLDAKCANQILALLTSEEIGMLPPFSNQKDLGCECGCRGRCVKGHEWDYSHLPEGALQGERIYR